MSPAEKKTPSPIAWYRSPLSREQLAALNRKSDLKGFLQTGGFLGLLALTATAASLSAGRLPWTLVLLLFFLHGTCWHFMINGFHELVHESVFRTRWLNGFFLRILSFLGWHNHHAFWASHTEHHKFTLHPPDDLEVLTNDKASRAAFFQTAFVSYHWFFKNLATTFRHARGKLQGEWEHHLFPASNPKAKQNLVRWARIVLMGHGAIVTVSLLTGWWWLTLAVTLAPFYGGWLHYLCNNTQHAGLQEHAPDFRLCCRTITLHPFVQFLYWHMNFHTEHHMYAAVPCYNLGKLHRLIRSDLPPCPHGLMETWLQIGEILKRQKSDPGYQYLPPLPA